MECVSGWCGSQPRKERVQRKRSAPAGRDASRANRRMFCDTWEQPSRQITFVQMFGALPCRHRAITVTPMEALQFRKVIDCRQLPHTMASYATPYTASPVVICVVCRCRGLVVPAIHDGHVAKRSIQYRRPWLWNRLLLAATRFAGSRIDQEELRGVPGIRGKTGLPARRPDGDLSGFGI